MKSFFMILVNYLSKFDKFFILLPVILVLSFGCFIPSVSAYNDIYPDSSGQIPSGRHLFSSYSFEDVFYVGSEIKPEHIFYFFTEPPFNDSSLWEYPNHESYNPYDTYWREGDDFCWFNGSRTDFTFAELYFEFQDFFLNWTQEDYVDPNSFNYYRFDIGLNFGGPNSALCKPSNFHSVNSFHIRFGNELAVLTPTSIYQTSDYNGTSRTTATFTFMVPASFFSSKELVDSNFIRLYFYSFSNYNISSIRFRIDPDVGFTLSEVSEAAYLQWLQNDSINNTIDDLGEVILNAGSDVPQPDFSGSLNNINSTTDSLKNFDEQYKVDSNQIAEASASVGDLFSGSEFNAAAVFIRNQIDRLTSEVPILLTLFSVVLVLGLSLYAIGRGF